MVGDQRWPHGDGLRGRCNRGRSGLDQLRTKLSGSESGARPGSEPGLPVSSRPGRPIAATLSLNLSSACRIWKDHNLRPGEPEGQNPGRAGGSGLLGGLHSRQLGINVLRVREFHWLSEALFADDARLLHTTRNALRACSDC